MYGEEWDSGGWEEVEVRWRAAGDGDAEVGLVGELNDVFCTRRCGCSRSALD
ncbi:hypothetical protein BC834DRAFT_895055 [Gloeopeniophorella convolvens]|nr:hypothetical protein BC834DRAFT_895055 [Gloeopeniophorella convolvens]